MPAIYPLWKQSIEKGDADSDLDNNTTTDGPYCALVNTGVYVFDAAHQFYSSLSGILGTDQRIVTPTVSTSGIFDGDDLVFPLVTGAQVGALVIYRKNAGASTTWRLVYYYDGPNLPVLPLGANVEVHWNGQGIFRL